MLYTAVSPSMEVNLYGPSHIFFYFFYTRTVDPDGIFLSFRDYSLPLGPPGCHNSNAIPRLACSWDTAPFDYSIDLFLYSWLVDGISLAARCMVPKTSFLGQSPSGPIVELTAYTSICRHSASSYLNLSIDFWILWYAIRKGESYCSTISIDPGLSIGASSITTPATSMVPSLPY